MFRSILPADIDDGNRHRAERLAAGLGASALRTEQAAVALMLRLPHGVGLRDDLWRNHVVADEAGDVSYTWPDLAKDAVDGELPMSRGERYLVRAACALANPMRDTPLYQLVRGVDTGCFDLLIAALYHAAGRPNPADQLAERDAELAELRRRLDGYAVADAAARDEIARLRAELADATAVRGVEDGAGEPLPDGVDGVPVGAHPARGDHPEGEDEGGDGPVAGCRCEDCEELIAAEGGTAAGLRTPEQWLRHPEYAGIQVIDADGWRHDDQPWTEPISRAEFELRLYASTIDTAPAAATTGGTR